MASNLCCHFANLGIDLYPPRFNDCQGELVGLEECTENDENGYNESYLILLILAKSNKNLRKSCKIYSYLHPPLVIIKAASKTSKQAPKAQKQSIKTTHLARC